MVILIVEDDAINAFMMEQSLVDLGHHVIGPTSTLEEALLLIEGCRADLALLDINLGSSTGGIDLAKTFRSRWDIPCVFVTGQVDLARAHRDDVLGVLAKPFSPQTLCDAVDYLQDRLAGRGSAKTPSRLEMFGDQYC